MTIIETRDTKCGSTEKSQKSRKIPKCEKTLDDV